MITIEISDTGIGINEELQSKLFQLFDNFKYKHVINTGGCGIGLTLCKKLCDIMNF